MKFNKYRKDLKVPSQLGNWTVFIEKSEEIWNDSRKNTVKEIMIFGIDSKDMILQEEMIDYIDTELKKLKD